MPKHTRPREPLPHVAEFIRFVQSRLVSGAGFNRDGMWFSHRDEGSLSLDAEETSAFSRTVNELETQHVPREDLSRRSIEGFLQEAIFAALDLRARSTSSFEERLRTALDHLLQTLRAPPQVFRCWVPVEGLQLDSARAQFGGIRFVRFGRNQVRHLKTEHQRRRADVNLKQIRESNIWGSVCGVVDVRARDSSAAEGLALRQARRTLDVLNLFTDLVPYNNGWLYLRGETTPATQVVPMQKRGNPYFNVSYTHLDPLAQVSWKKLTSAKHIARPFRTLDRIAKGHKAPGICSTVLWASAQWAGRATVDRRREQSFLLYAIAMETLLLPTKETQGLGHRLRLRVAHLLGRTVAARERIAKEMGRLYGIRSKIVHAGSYEVTDLDLGSLRSLVKGAIFRLALMPRIHSMSPQQLSDWLDRKLLR